MAKPSNNKALTKKPIPIKKPKPNVRAFLNNACEVAVEIVNICGLKTSQGQLLNDEELKNMKLAADIITKARSLTIQAKANSVFKEPEAPSINLDSAAILQFIKSNKDSK